MDYCFKHFIVLVALLFSANLTAGEVPYDKAAFENAVAEGKPAIVEFFADWCPTCKTQKPVARSTGQTRKDDIAATFAKAL